MLSALPKKEPNTAIRPDTPVATPTYATVLLKVLLSMTRPVMNIPTARVRLL